ncbi:MAB_1171c family putative transporter [Catenulispora subtropica]|uniref:DUF6545 domain-containing protein n=1 Tax=Catenulispora subtropica TaxID=450798 RepID=A0ABN2SE31_9ACTN
MALASDLGAYAGTAVLLGFVGYRFSSGRRTAPDPFRWVVYGFGLFEACSLVILAPASLRLLTDVGVGEAGVVGLGDSLRTAAVSCLVGVASALQPVSGDAPATSATSLNDSTQSAHSSPSPRSWLVPAIVVQLVMGALFALARPEATADGTLSVDMPGRWALVARSFLFVGYTLFCLAVLAAALLPQARHGHSRQLRIGVQLVVAAIALGGVWTMWTLDDILSVARHGFQGGSDDSISNLFGVSCAILLLAGATVRGWGRALTAPRRWWRAYRRYRALGPLWSALHRALPEIALAPDDRPRPGAAADIEFLAYRRAIEIHDARLALRQHRQPHFTEWLAAAGVDVHGHSTAELEAAALAVAVENLRHDRQFEPTTSDPVTDQAPGTDAGAESRWLVEVARAFQRSPLVRLAAERARETGGATG